jgi:hypothetical protein
LLYLKKRKIFAVHDARAKIVLLYAGGMCCDDTPVLSLNASQIEREVLNEESKGGERQQLNLGVKQSITTNCRAHFSSNALHLIEPRKIDFFIQNLVMALSSTMFESSPSSSSSACTTIFRLVKIGMASAVLSALSTMMLEQRAGGGGAAAGRAHAATGAAMATVRLRALQDQNVG